MFLVSKHRILFVLSLIMLISCKKKPTIEPIQGLHFVDLETPAFFPQLILNPENPTSMEGMALGRKLYYDPILSNTGESCSSCHFQESGFSSAAANSLPHVNLAWNQFFLWKGNIEGPLEDAMLFEVEDFFSTDVSKLQNNSYYREQFKKVFGVDQIKSKDIAFALAQFIRSMVSSNSRYDQYRRGEIMLTEAELNGMDIFFTERGDCFHCHTEGLFTDNSFHNPGLDAVFNSGNFGRYSVTGNTADIGKFKTPTLRNIELTAPYMHDGRFSSLEQVVEFYNSQVHVTEYTDPIMTKPGKEFGLQLSSEDKMGLISFLKALTDSSFIQNSAFSHP